MPMVPKYEWKLNMKIVKSAGEYRKYTYSWSTDLIGIQSFYFYSFFFICKQCPRKINKKLSLFLKVKITRHNLCSLPPSEKSRPIFFFGLERGMLSIHVYSCSNSASSKSSNPESVDWSFCTDIVCVIYIHK